MINSNRVKLFSNFIFLKRKFEGWTSLLLYLTFLFQILLLNSEFSDFLLAIQSHFSNPSSVIRKLLNGRSLLITILSLRLGKYHWTLLFLLVIHQLFFLLNFSQNGWNRRKFIRWNIWIHTSVIILLRTLFLLNRCQKQNVCESLFGIIVFLRKEVFILWDLVAPIALLVFFFSFFLRVVRLTLYKVHHLLIWAILGKWFCDVL